MLERDIEEAVIKHAKTKGFLAYKFSSPNSRSVPDRIFITPEGVVFFIEFKQKGKYPTNLQASTIKRLEANKAKVFIVNDIDKGKSLIDKYA